MILEDTKKGIDSILPIPNVNFSFGKFGEPSFDVMGKCFEIIQLSPENLRDRVVASGVFTRAEAVRGRRSRIRFHGDKVVYTQRGTFASDHVPVWTILKF